MSWPQPPCSAVKSRGYAMHTFLIWSYSNPHLHRCVVTHAHLNVQIKDMIPPLARSTFKDLYVVYELMDTDLHQIIRSPQGLSDDHCQYFLYQVSMHHLLSHSHPARDQVMLLPGLAQ